MSPNISAPVYLFSKFCIQHHMSGMRAPLFKRKSVPSVFLDLVIIQMLPRWKINSFSSLYCHYSGQLEADHMWCTISQIGILCCMIPSQSIEFFRCFWLHFSLISKGWGFLPAYQSVSSVKTKCLKPFPYGLYLCFQASTWSGQMCPPSCRFYWDGCLLSP